MLRAIFAMQDGDRLIGRDGGLPWQLPGELGHFKRTTAGGVLVMGRRTWESLPGVLPGRPHLIVSRSLAAENLPADIELLRNTTGIAARAAADQRPWWLIGGATLFGELLGEIGEIVLTRVFGNYRGDTFLPPFEAGFELVEVGSRQGQWRVERWIRLAGEGEAGG